MSESKSIESETPAAVAGAAPCSANSAITEMALCEVPHIFLRPGQLYRFVVMPGCKACEEAAAPYSPNAGADAPATDDKRTL